jgi:NADH-quinone oxidoreductase subunit N
MNPSVDLHALAPEIVLTAGLVVLLLADVLVPERSRWQIARLAPFVVLAALVPVITLATSDANARVLFDGAYVVDDYSLVFKGFFIVVAYLAMLLSADYITEGDYYQGEYWFLLVASVLGMVVMASARDLITVFIALELISLPTFALVAWRKHDPKSNEAAMKYYLIGVMSSAVMLFGMSYLYGLSNTTTLAGISRWLTDNSAEPLAYVAVFLTLVGFAFKVSAVPFHFWAPDTYEGAPTPVTAFLSVASKAGGFVALLTIIYFGVFPATNAWQPVMWFLAAASMFVGNLIALRQTNIVRMLAYSSIAQGGFILAPLGIAAAGDAGRTAFGAVVVYLVLYAFMNLGAFAVVIAVARRTGSGMIDSYAGLGRTSPWLAISMSAFLFSLAGIPPLAGWFAKFGVLRAIVDANTPWAYVLGVIVVINTVIAFVYYGAVARRMWFDDPAAEEESSTGGAGAVVTRPKLRTNLTPALAAVIGVCALATIVFGVYPQPVAKLGELAAESVLPDRTPAPPPAGR